jgi:hypothetical protein
MGILHLQCACYFRRHLTAASLCVENIGSMFDKDNKFELTRITSVGINLDASMPAPSETKSCSRLERIRITNTNSMVLVARSHKSRMTAAQTFVMLSWSSVQHQHCNQVISINFLCRGVVLVFDAACLFKKSCRILALLHFDPIVEHFS